LRCVGGTVIDESLVGDQQCIAVNIDDAVMRAEGFAGAPPASALAIRKPNRQWKPGLSQLVEQSSQQQKLSSSGQLLYRLN
jgi:hypothetical protein